ncbi:DUF6508 domain-containing protein [Pseudomonas sp. Pseusp122]|uniref:DUF6508 domain-containing protein n=1 Tax=unclassified Pseudomonas TaxID=196821 RepID=UPI0039A4AC7D
MTVLPIPSKKTVEIILDHAPDFRRLKTLSDEEQQYELSTFLAVVYATDFMIPFDWMKEFAGKHNKLADPALLTNADAATVRKLLIANLRLDRFSTGHIEHLLRSGYLEAALDRLRVLFAVP